MASSTLMLHRGAVEVPRSEVEVIPAPPPTKTWFPLSHGEVINTVERRLDDAGFGIAKARYALSHENHRLFATLDLESPVAQGVVLAVGIRNSTDQTFPIGWACGNRVFCCDNLSFSAEMVISRKHTRFGQRRFGEALSNALANLIQFKQLEERRIRTMQHDELTDDRANSLMLQAFEGDVVTSRLLPKVISEWRKPSHDEFQPRTTWSLLNAFTEALKAKLTVPAVHAALTIKLQGLLCRGDHYQVAV